MQRRSEITALLLCHLIILTKNISIMKNMKTKFLYLMLAMIIATTIVFADELDQEVEIQLIEVVGVGIIGGDEPLDGPGEAGNNPTDPNQFHATITGHTLSVTVFNTHTTYMLVRNVSGSIILSRQFVGHTTEQLPSGSYSLELISIGVSYLGDFEVE